MKVSRLGYLFTVKIDNGFQGRQFMLRNEQEIIDFGFSPNSVKNALSQHTLIFGMAVTRINPSVHKGERYDDILALFNKNRNYFNTVIIPIIGKVIDDGPYQGQVFSLFGTVEAEHYFTKMGVLNTSRNKQASYRGCTFKLATHREAIPLHNNLTQDMADYLEEKYARIKKGK